MRSSQASSIWEGGEGPFIISLRLHSKTAGTRQGRPDQALRAGGRKDRPFFGVWRMGEGEVCWQDRRKICFLLIKRPARRRSAGFYSKNGRGGRTWPEEARSREGGETSLGWRKTFHYRPLLENDLEGRKRMPPIITRGAYGTGTRTPLKQALGA